MQVSFAGNMLYWTRLLEMSFNRMFVAAAPTSTAVSVWRVLAWLSEYDSLTVGELALRTHMERTVLGRLLERMEGQGLIERAAAVGDRRINLARISATGRRAFARIQPIRSSIYQKAIRGIGSKDIETARRVIIAMVDNLSAAK